MKNNQSIRNYSNITNSDKVTRSNDLMKNSQRIKIAITNNDKILQRCDEEYLEYCEQF